MTLWDQIACREQLQLIMREYYSRKCQAEIRVMFAKWIETQMMYESRTNNEVEYEISAQNFVRGLKEELSKYAHDPNFSTLLDAISQFPELEFYMHLRNGIRKELDMVNSGRNGNHPLPMEENDEYNIRMSINELSQSVQYCIRIVQKFQSSVDRFQIQYNEFSRRDRQEDNINTAALGVTIEEEYKKITVDKLELLTEFKTLVIKYDVIRKLVIDKELKNWQRNQALGGNGAPYKDNLDDIQSWIESLLEIAGKLRAQITVVLTCTTQFFNNTDTTEFNNVLRHIIQEQERLIISAFIVEKQPPQVMKTHTRFAATVRWLIGPQLGISMTNPTVECIILSESQAQRHCAQRQMSDSPPTSCGEILNNVGTMELQQQSRHFSASFRTMQLKKIKRAEKKGTESVMDEKFALLFYTSSVVNDYRIRAWTLSLPVVVIVHGNQEPQSWATITWDNAFSEINREPFIVPDKVPWSMLSGALNTKFCSQTKRALTEDNMHVLYEKILRNDVMGDHKDYITWAQFCKEPLPSRTFTFWDWFFAIMKLTKDHLMGPWQAGRIVGFVSKQKTTEELKQYPVGTFLLRFSDSELGAISIAWLTETSEVLMLQPWSAKDLTVRALADRIQDLTYLRFLYPNINRDDAFKDFYSSSSEEQEQSSDGYVRNKIKAYVPGYTAPTESFANTPQHTMQSPNPNDMQTMPSSDGILFPINQDIDFGDIDAW